MKKHCIGIDIGGTSVKFGLFDLEGTLLEKWNIPSRLEENGKNILSDVADSLNGKLKEMEISKEEVIGAGIGVAGQVSEDGVVVFSENLGWENIPVTEELSHLTGLSFQAENDANVAAFGELWKGSAANYHSMIFVTLGTGVGGAVIVNNRILTGAAGAAGEIGHIHVEDHAKEACNCGNYGCLEQFASGNGIVRLVEMALENSDEPSVLRNQEICAKSIFEAVKQKDVIAVSVAEQFGDYMGKALAACTCVINPEVIVIGGGVSKAGEIILEYIRKYYKKYAYLPCENTEIRLASLGNDAGIYGGARLALNEIC